MYFLTGKKACDNKLITIYRLQHGINHSPDSEEIKEKYLDFVETHYGSYFNPRRDKDLRCTDTHDVSKITSIFLSESVLNDIPADALETPSDSMNEALDRVSDVLDWIKSVDFDLYLTFQSYIHTMIYNRTLTTGGGSNSLLPGVIWFGHRKNWCRRNIGELIIHELTHNIMFIDELLNRHHPAAEHISDKRLWPISTILKRPRPVDKVLHSLVVASEVLAFRRIFGEPTEYLAHPPSFEIAESMAQTILSLRHINSTETILCPRGLEIVTAVESTLIS
jgi:hypothetical protein